MTVVVQEKWMDAGGFRTRFLEAGSPTATPVLLLHDGAWGGASSVTWNKVMPRLSEDYRVLAPDLVGFGGSDKVVYTDRAQYEARIAQVRGFVEALGIVEPVHLVGNSFGGSVALRMLANDHSIPLRSVIAVCGTGGPWRSELAKTELGHWDGTETDLRRVVNLLIDTTEYFEPHVGERMRWAADVGHYRAVMAASTKLPAALVAERPTDEWPAQLAGTTTPVMLVAGKRDVLLDPEWTARLREVVPRARVEVLDCKHAPNIDRPELLLPVLRDFLDGQ